MSQILHGDIHTEHSTPHTHDEKTPATVMTTEAKSYYGQQQPGSIRATAEEEPKAPVSSNRWTALKSCLPVLAPIPVTIAVITLQYVHVYISAEYQSQDFYVNNWHIHISELQNALQLPASIYGLLITTSVSAIALHRIRYELAEREGVALGYLLAGYQLNNLSTLLSKAFWTGSYARARGGTRLQHLSLLTLVSLCIFLAHFGQSMGAMLIVPKPAWWKVRHLDNTEIDAFIANKTEIYPQHLTQSTLPDGSCLSSTALQNESCPAGGYSTILGTLSNWNAEYLRVWNMTFFNDDASRELVSVSLLINNSSYDSSLTSSPQQVFVRSVADYFQWPHNWKLTLKTANKQPLLMPLVQVQCAAISSSSSTIQFPYSNLVYPPFSQLPNTTNWTIFASDFADNSGNPVQFSWADLSGFSPGPSIGAVVILSQNLNIPDGFTTTPSNDSILACTIDARWAPVQLYLQPYVDGTVHPDNPYADGTKPLTQIQIDPSWAESLNLPVPGSQLTTMETIIQDLVYKDLEDTATSNPTYFLPDLAVSLGSTITDGLARIGWQEHFAFTMKTETDSLQLITVSDNGTVLSNSTYSEAQTAGWLHLEWKVEHYGYGFSAATITAKVAMAVLLLHAALAIGHTAVVCLPRKVWSCDGWGSIAGLVVLAMNSRPDERLLNMSAGIRLKQSWREIVKIREFGEEGLELLVAEDTVIGEKWMGKEGEKLKPGKKYGTDLGN